MKKLKEDARYLKIKGYSSMKKDELEQAIRDRNLKSVQTYNPLCESCALKQVIHGLQNKARKVAVAHNGLKVDADTGEVLSSDTASYQRKNKNC